MEGNYVLTRFRMRPALSKELEANLQISEEVLRHLLVRLSVGEGGMPVSHGSEEG